MAKIFRPSEHYVPTSFSALTWLSRVRFPESFFLVCSICLFPMKLKIKQKMLSYSEIRKLSLRNFFILVLSNKVVKSITYSTLLGINGKSMRLLDEYMSLKI